MQDADQITGAVDDEYQFQEDHQDNSDDEEDSDNDSSISDSSSDTDSSDSDDENDANGDDDEQVDTAELHDVLEDDTNPIQHQDEEDNEVKQDEQESMLDDQDDDEEDDGLPRQSTRIRKEPERLNITSTTGKSYAGQQSHLQGVETTNKVYFADQQQASLERLEYVHNLVAQVRPSPDDNLEYLPSEAMLIARVMTDIQEKMTKHGASFAQQYIMQKGLKLFGDQGRDGVNKEINYTNGVVLAQCLLKI
jgi:hypothetical protein